MLSKALVVGAYQRKAEELARLPDMELVVMVPPGWREGKGYLLLERSHLEGYELIEEKMLFNGHFHYHLYPRLSRHLHRLRPHLVHVDEEPYNLATLHAMMLARRVGARALFFTWQNLYRQYPLPFRLVERACYALSDGAIAGSEGAREVLRRKGYTKPVAVIPQFGVDPDLFSPGERETVRPRLAGQAPFTIGYLGRLVQAKGLDTLLEAVAGLEGNWRLRLVGNGEYRPHLASRIERLGLGERVELRDGVPSEAVPAQLRQLDVLVLPSLTTPRWKEQFGRVLVEAMACEVAVVGSDSGEIPGVIGEAGLVFPEGQAQSLRAALQRLANDPALRRQLSQAGRRRVLERYTQARIAEQTYEVYERTLRGEL